MRRGSPRTGGWYAVVKEVKGKGKRTTLTITMKGMLNLTVPVTHSELHPATNWPPFKRLKRLTEAKCKP